MKHFIATLFILLISYSSFAQVRGTGEIVKQERQVGTFNKVKISGAQDAILMNGEQYSVVIETNQNLLEHISVVIQDGNLWIDYKNIKHYDRMKFYITAPEFNKVAVSGASDVKSVDTLRGTKLWVSGIGASDVNLIVDYESIQSKASGASDITLSGNATSHVAEVSGASNIIAKAMKTETTNIRASGASSCFVEARSSLTYRVSGSSTVKYVGTPETLIIQDDKATKNVVIMNDQNRSTSVYSYDDTTTVNLGAFDVQVIEGDTTRVSVGRHTIIVDDDGNVKYERNKKKKFNGHWGGVELGINGYVTPDFNTDFNSDRYDQNYDYLTLRYEKSTAVNLNIYEQNIALNKDKNMGIVTGIGMAWNNYRFSQQTFLTPDSSEVWGFLMEDVSVRKTKLTAMYITVPIMFEIQTKNPRRLKRFHFAVGALISARVRTHTKIYFNEANKEYKLRNITTDELMPGVYVTPNANDRNIVKNYNSFYLQPFKFDGMVRIGYSIINIFGTYSLNTLFQNGRGPELNAWTIGITLVGW